MPRSWRHPDMYRDLRQQARRNIVDLEGGRTRRQPTGAAAAITLAILYGLALGFLGGWLIWGIG